MGALIGSVLVGVWWALAGFSWVLVGFWWVFLAYADGGRPSLLIVFNSLGAFGALFRGVFVSVDF